MIRLRSISLAKLCAAGAMMFAASSAFAIGPSYQYVLDPVPVAITPMNDVVSLGIGNNMQGTGTIIGYQIDQVTGNTYDMVFNILTAAHVANTGINQVNIGAGFNAYDNAGNAQSYIFSAPLNGSHATYTLNDPIDNPKNLPEDVAIMQGNYYFNPDDEEELANVDLVTDSLVKLSTDFYNSEEGYQPENITQAGYGQGGVWNGGTSRYLHNSMYDARRFQNNNSTAFNNPAVVLNTFFQPLVDDQALAPTANGNGAGFDGDSGGPWFTGGNNANVTVTPKNPDDYNGGNPPKLANGNVVGANTVIPVDYSNNESAVFVLNTRFPNTDVPVDTVNMPPTTSPQSAVPLLTTADTLALLDDPTNDYDNEGSYEWANGYAGINPSSIVPEPAALSLIALSAFGLLRRRRAH
jgi:hypothetical protein